MTTRNPALAGTPCWADLWTSDVEGSRHFYSQLFGWDALEPDQQYGGYFNFARQGAWTAGCMGPMGDMTPNNTWKPYLSTDDIDGTLKRIEAAGGSVISAAMPVGPLGSQAVVADPAGAEFGLWQPGTWPGFSVVGEPSAPSWFELHTDDYAAVVPFYRDIFGYEITAVSDTDEFRYFTFRRLGSDDDLGGIADSRTWLEDRGSHWAIYWEVTDVAAIVATAEQLGGSLLQGPDDTPYGVLASVADPAGAQFKLRTANA
jgi:predicted enzyme related to lactoylglutathione lyase